MLTILGTNKTDFSISAGERKDTTRHSASAKHNQHTQVIAHQSHSIGDFLTVDAKKTETYHHHDSFAFFILHFFR